MLQCTDCEFFHRGADGRPILRCDPFSTIKEPECLQKLQLITLGSLEQAYQATLRVYERLAPIQERMFQQMERELDDAEEADAWKYVDDDEDLDDDDLDDDDNPGGNPPGGTFTL